MADSSEVALTSVLASDLSDEEFPESAFGRSRTRENSRHG
jgi:hypothetical protein